jgi:hypothetical protein
MEFYRDCNGVVERFKKLLITHLKVVKNFCFCVVLFVEEVGKGANDGGQGGGWKVMV